jgi:hypothetical protein
MLIGFSILRVGFFASTHSLVFYLSILFFFLFGFCCLFVSYLEILIGFPFYSVTGCFDLQSH